MAAKGRRGGRKLKLKPERVAALKTMYESKAHTVEEVCAVFGISKPTLYPVFGGITFPPSKLFFRFPPGKNLTRP